MEMISSSSLSYPLLDDVNIEFRPNDFIQVNHKVNQLMVKQAIQWLALSKSDNVLDLFCYWTHLTLHTANLWYHSTLLIYYDVFMSLRPNLSSSSRDRWNSSIDILLSSDMD